MKPRGEIPSMFMQTFKGESVYRSKEKHFWISVADVVMGRWMCEAASARCHKIAHHSYHD